MAPIISVSRGTSAALVVRQLPKRAVINMQVKSGNRWASLGKTRTTARGQAVLPPVDGRRNGEYLIRLQTAGERPLYLKVLVTRP